VRPRAAGVEDLPPALLSKSEELKRVVDALEKAEVVVESGKSTDINPTGAATILDQAGLTPTLAKPEIRALVAKEKPTDQEISLALTTIHSSFADPAQKEQLRAATDKPVDAPKIEEVPKQDFDRKLKEYEEFIAVDQSKLKDAESTQKAIQARSAEQREQRIQRIEQIMQKSAETLILNNGTRVRGVIYQQGADYMVLTPEGKQFFNGADVNGLEF